MAVPDAQGQGPPQPDIGLEGVDEAQAGCYRKELVAVDGAEALDLAHGQADAAPVLGLQDGVEFVGDLCGGLLEQHGQLPRHAEAVVARHPGFREDPVGAGNVGRGRPQRTSGVRRFGWQRAQGSIEDRLHGGAVRRRGRDQLGLEPLTVPIVVVRLA